MQVWIASVIILFALSQFLEWLHGVEFSLPMLTVGGLLLAIASNYDKRTSIPWWPKPNPKPLQTISTTPFNSIGNSVPMSLGPQEVIKVVVPASQSAPSNPPNAEV